ncbi:MAG: PQQ-binding-like beta-propeller repeat protein [Burkholderiales bacterium]
MNRWSTELSGSMKALSAAALIGFATTAMAVDADRLRNADKDPNNWLMYHGSYKAWHYSDLSQINRANVKNLRVSWIHTPSASKRGVQSFPLAVDGTLYYTSASGQVWALDGATGDVKWKYAAKLDQERSEGTFYNPYNRGIAIGYGNVYMGTTDGRMIALDMNTGKVVWDKMILTVEGGNKGFTGAPVIVKDMVVIGSNGGELSGCCGPIFAVDAKTGEVRWQFDTIGGDERSRSSWGNDSWKTGGGGGWMTGTYDEATNSVWWGTANPAPDYDWAGEKWKTEGARPGDNLYSSSVVVLNADTGELKSWFQEMPHDAWDFDSAVGEFMSIERGGKRYMLHPNKGGIIFVYNADPSNAPLKVENAYMLGKTYNYIKGVDAKTGQLIGRRELPEGKHTNVCPAIDGAISWNTGAYNPNTGLLYKVGQEWCFDIEVVKADPPPAFSGQAYFGASWTSVHPDGRKAFGHVSARDPLTGKIKWEKEYKYPPLASLLATKGNIVFVPGADGRFDALDAQTGATLWQHNNGIGHHGGVISYTAKGKQYVAVVTGWGSHVSGNYCPLFGEPFCSMPTDAGQLLVFSLP